MNDAREEVAVALYVQDTGMPECWATEEDGPRGWYRDMADAALRALLTPTMKCEDCGGSGTGFHPCGDEPPRCPSCDGSGRVEKGPIAYLSAELEQVGWFTPDIEPPYNIGFDPAEGFDNEPVYRLPSESTNGVKDEY